ncbi:glycerophosphodiester phosphodiesterase family protein [Bradyrhizobium sp. NDS-1]|uniref:glycerophosphodiester phosphodiesterase family protein n=1 Tax=Bradyrhizobium sp. NDS-1 TaxID=3080014 RepID=UPI00293EFC7A|nr:glycerophosphodiester phosphodiesterase family protein [Bradyrhizobium sp. NDS-1]WOH75460.1 glycerophosphodiester phosphodiesterase family protein [Bradyrhizobium sp. NDS-1]
MLRQGTVLLNSSGTVANVTDLRGDAVRNVFSCSMRRWRKQLTRLGLIGTIVVASAAAGSVTDANAGDEAKAAMQTQIGWVQPRVPACGETTQKFGSNDPDDPVDDTVNKMITKWLAAGNKAAWKSSFGLDRRSLADAESEIDTSGYGKDLFLTGPEAKTRGIDPHRKQILPHRGLFDNSKGILENTISAADNALKHGFHRVELDLRADKSGHAWMIHDSTLGRVTGDPNNCLISDVPTEEIKNMNLSIWNPINNERLPALDRHGNPQQMEDLQKIIDYVREKNRSGDEFNVIIDPKDEVSTIAAIKALSALENADVRRHLGIKIYSTYVPITDRDVARWENKTTKVLDALVQANVPVQLNNRLNLIPVLIKAENVQSPHIDKDQVTQAGDWLTSFDRLGNLTMVEISRFKGTDNFDKMNQVTAKFQAAGKKFASTPVTASYISEAFSVNGQKFYYSAQGVPITLPGRPDMEFRATFGALEPYADVLLSDNVYLETLYATGYITEGSHADYAFPIDAHYNPASIIAAPKVISDKPSWMSDPRHR